MDIPEYKRDDSLDYIKVLRALMEFRFSLGRNNLIEFLEGNRMNKTVIKHDLDELANFGSLKSAGKHKISEYIERLTANGMMELSETAQNRFMRIYNITPKGMAEIALPTLNKKQVSNKVSHYKTNITDTERMLFEELTPFIGKYNDEQKKAIISDKRNILCIAGAGSGKTTVLTKRIEFLVKFKSVEAQKILAITFTRKARKEMENRLDKLGIHNVNVETFNSFSEKILRKHFMEIYGRNMKVMSYADKIALVRESLRSMSMDVKSAIDIYFSPAQKRNKTPEKMANTFIGDCFTVLDYFKIKEGGLTDFRKGASAGDKSAVDLVYKVCSYVDTAMKERGLRDYTDQIIDTLAFFKNNSSKIPYYSHILVDEYQDVNSAQINLLDLLMPQNLFCVGDPRQAIFGWRGSDINYILDLPKKFPDTEVINLVKNYRSGKKIVQFMNKAISRLKLPDLEHSEDHTIEEEVDIHELGSFEEEIDFIMQRIRQAPVPHEEIFVLARTNKQLEQLSFFMKKAGIPHVLKDENSEAEVEQGRVTLATIHAIKGLEAKLVFVIGCSSKNFPCKISDHPVVEMVKLVDYDKEEEERRVFYVAVSRAKEKLCLTYSGRKSYFISD